MSKTAELDPQNAEAWNNLCWYRAIINQLDEALRDCERSLLLRPNDFSTLDSLGFVYLKSHDWDHAIESYTAALKIQPKAEYSLYGRGLARLKKGQNEDGEEDIKNALTIKAGLADDFKQFGLCVDSDAAECNL
jgi:tetratricopeptide (TPR) repeat protein